MYQIIDFKYVCRNQLDLRKALWHEKEEAEEKEETKEETEEKKGQVLSTNAKAHNEAGSLSL